jgi:peptidoglycan/LPS O-acetylase OafA/YrhL
MGVIAVKFERDVSLDAMRGIAALVVFGWHSVLAFYPDFSGYLGSTAVEDTARSQFWFAAINGPGAVAFFFVLSGFVLSRAYLLNGDRNVLVRGVVKRWPRLAGPAVVAALASWLLFRTGAYFYQQASEISHSSWLAHFAGAYAGEPFAPTLASAFLQGAFLTFLRGDCTYDGSLWTMTQEFYGSVVVYALCLLHSHCASERTRIVALAFAALACHVSAPSLTPFVLGVALAAFLPVRGFRLPGWAAAAAVVLALLASGYTRGAGGFYAGVTAVFPADLPVSYVYAFAAATLIATAGGSNGMKAFLSRRWGHVAGEMSFPFYLVHALTLCSVGAFTLTATGSKPAAIAATFASSLAAAWLLARFNRWWVDRLNDGVATLLSGETKPLPLVGTHASSS